MAQALSSGGSAVGRGCRCEFVLKNSSSDGISHKCNAAPAATPSPCSPGWNVQGGHTAAWGLCSAPPFPVQGVAILPKAELYPGRTYHCITAITERCRESPCGRHPLRCGRVGGPASSVGRWDTEGQGPLHPSVDLGLALTAIIFPWTGGACRFSWAGRRELRDHCA